MTSIIFILLTILSYLGVYLIRRYAEKHELLDHPNERSSHEVLTPRGGGLAIVILVLAAGLWSASEATWDRGLIYVFGGALIAWL